MTNPMAAPSSSSLPFSCSKIPRKPGIARDSDAADGDFFWLFESEVETPTLKSMVELVKPELIRQCRKVPSHLDYIQENGQSIFGTVPGTVPSRLASLRSSGIPLPPLSVRHRRRRRRRTVEPATFMRPNTFMRRRGSGRRRTTVEVESDDDDEDDDDEDDDDTMTTTTTIPAAVTVSTTDNERLQNLPPMMLSAISSVSTQPSVDGLMSLIRQYHKQRRQQQQQRITQQSTISHSSSSSSSSVPTPSSVPTLLSSRTPSQSQSSLLQKVISVLASKLEQPPNLDPSMFNSNIPFTQLQSRQQNPHSMSRPSSVQPFPNRMSQTHHSSSKPVPNQPSYRQTEFAPALSTYQPSHGLSIEPEQHRPLDLMNRPPFIAFDSQTASGDLSSITSPSDLLVLDNDALDLLRDAIGLYSSHSNNIVVSNGSPSPPLEIPVTSSVPAAQIVNQASSGFYCPPNNTTDLAAAAETALKQAALIEAAGGLTSQLALHPASSPNVLKSFNDQLTAQVRDCILHHFSPNLLLAAHHQLSNDQSTQM